jgi:hypothetical protein
MGIITYGGYDHFHDVETINFFDKNVGIYLVST